MEWLLGKKQVKLENQAKRSRVTGKRIATATKTELLGVGNVGDTGHEVGSIVGTDVGTAVRNKVGTEVGVAVGTDVAVGPNSGRAVGTEVKATVGDKVGISEDEVESGVGVRPIHTNKSKLVTERGRW